MAYPPISRPLHYGPPIRIALPTIVQGGRRGSDALDEASQYDWIGAPEPVPAFFSEAATARPNSKRLYNEVKSLLDKYEYGGRLREYGQLLDLQRAIALLYELLILVPYDRDPPAHSVHKALGDALLMRYKHNNLGYKHNNDGDPEDLRNALIELEKAFNSAPSSFIDKAPYYADLGCALQSQYERFPRLESLERAISLQRGALEYAPEEHPRRWMFLDALACSLLSRFEFVDDLSDLDESILLQRRAFGLMPDHYPYGSQMRDKLVALLRRRYERLGHLDDVNSAITLLCASLERHLGHGDLLEELSYYLEIRFKRTDDFDDLRALIGALQGVAEHMADAHPKKPPALDKLACYLQTIHRRLGFPHILEQADSSKRHAEFSRQAVQRLDFYEPPRTMRASELRRFMHLDELRSEILKMPYLSVDILPDELSGGELAALRASSIRHPRRSEYHLDIGMLDAPRHSGPASVRFEEAVRCVKVLSGYHDYCSVELLLEAHSNMFELIPKVFSLSQSADQRFASTSKIGRHVHEAVCLAIRARRFSEALEWLDSGRFLVWSQIIALRPPLDELSKQDASLAKEFGSVCDQLRKIGHGAHISLILHDNPADTNASVLAAKRRKLIRMHENLLSKIRVCRGFEDYLLPQNLKILLAGNDRFGTVVFLNVSTRCNALCLMGNGEMVPIELPELSLSRANQLLSVWSSNLTSCGVRERSTNRGDLPASKSRGVTAQFQHVLNHLWNWVVWPILQAIDIASPTVDIADLPHITWCVAGPLAQLPLHAAGVYSSNSGPRAHDYIVSSYTPSLLAHMRACRSQSRGTHAVPQKTLIIAQTSTPGFPPIQKTAVEGACVHQILSDFGVQCTTLDGLHATVTSVKSSLDHSAWVHIACHGAQHHFDPTLSGFALHDGILTLNMLMSVMAENAELVFLSACQTATGDEKLSDESAHLAAGMIAAGFRGVVATMWSIKDDDGPVVTKEYYRRLLELRSAGAVQGHETGAAYALHDAAKRLRELVGESDFVRWVPFVHFGV